MSALLTRAFRNLDLDEYFTTPRDQSPDFERHILRAETMIRQAYSQGIDVEKVLSIALQFLAINEEKGNHGKRR